jgi:flagellin
MSVVVNTNIASMRAQRSLASSGKDLQKAMERLVTGKRINSAADDPAGFAIAERMTSQIRGLSMAAKNANDALGLLEVVENAANDVTDMLQRVRELAIQAKSGTNNTSDVANLQKEADSLMDEITRISEDTTFNGVKHIGTEAGTKLIQVGYNDGDTISITTNKVDSISLGLVIDADADSVNDRGEYLDISSSTALASITTAIDRVSGYKAAWGASQNRLDYTVSNLMNVVEFTSAARSRIEDADFAVEAAKLATAQVLQQMAAAMFAQANAAPQLALQLIKQL